MEINTEIVTYSNIEAIERGRASVLLVRKNGTHGEFAHVAIRVVAHTLAARLYRLGADIVEVRDHGVAARVVVHAGSPRRLIDDALRIESVDRE